MIEDTLKDRGKIYGDYKGGSALRVEIMKGLKDRYKDTYGYSMSDIHQVYIFDIVNKLVRLATAPDHIDTWHDIAGYSSLIEEVLKDEEQESN